MNGLESERQVHTWTPHLLAVSTIQVTIEIESIPNSFSKVYYIFVFTVGNYSKIVIFVTPWTVACQAPLSMGFSRQEHWSVLPFPSPWSPPDPGIKPVSPALAGGFFITEPPEKPCQFLLILTLTTLTSLSKEEKVKNKEFTLKSEN